MSTAFTTTLRKKAAMGNGYQASFKLVGPTSYTTGGVAVNANLLFPSSGCRIIDHLIIKSVTGGLIAQWDEVNSKIVLFHPTGGSVEPSAVATAPAATATPASGATAVTSTSAQPAIPVTFTAGIAKEIGSGKDVSGVTVEILVQMR